MPWAAETGLRHLSTDYNTFRHWFLLCLTAWQAGPVCAQERERNTRDLGTERTDAAGSVTSWTLAGPLFFSKRASEGGTTSGFRPFWVQTKEVNGSLRSGLGLYPVFTYRSDTDTYAWSFFELVKRAGRKAGAPAPKSMLENGEAFDVWPFWFSRRADDPADSYRALFPFAGTIKRRLGFEQLSWTLFPFYVENHRNNAITTSTPWPFIRTTRGDAHGFALWPLFGWQERPGVSSDEFFLWPFAYRSTQFNPAEGPPGTISSRQFALLPLYAREQRAGFISENYLWPFFGYTNRTHPWLNHEKRYFWPFLVQGRGDERYINRWGPFYTHSVIKGIDKTWIAWPLYREKRWSEKGLVHTQTQFLWRIYWSLEQRSAINPSIAPAMIRHVWPLFSTWDNGAGRRQIQALSPFEVFFPGNTKVREVWAPLFALYRYDQRAPGHERHSLLWDLVSWETHTPHSANAALPIETRPGAQRVGAPEERLSLAGGLVGLRRPTGERAWRLFWLHFPKKSANVSAAQVATATVR